MKKTKLLILSMLPILCSCGFNNPNKSDDTSKAEVDPSLINHIEMAELPKTEFLYQESFSVEGGNIAVIYNSNEFDIVPLTLEMVTVPSMTLETEQVTVTYQGFTTSYYIHVQLTENTKEAPIISFNISANEVIYYDGTGKLPIINAIVEQKDCPYQVYFEQNGINIGTTVPTNPGYYSIICEVEGNSKYSSAREFRNFRIINKHIPVITFSISNGQSYVVGEEINITYTVNDPSIEHSYFYTADEGATNLGHNIPTKVGYYAINVVTVENDNYIAHSEFRWFKIVEA